VCGIEVFVHPAVDVAVERKAKRVFVDPRAYLDLE